VCKGPCRGALVSSQSRWLFGCIVVLRSKEHGAEAPKKSNAVRVSSGEHGPNVKARAQCFHLANPAISNRMQSRAIEGMFNMPRLRVASSKAYRHRSACIERHTRFGAEL